MRKHTLMVLSLALSGREFGYRYRLTIPILQYPRAPCCTLLRGIHRLPVRHLVRAALKDRFSPPEFNSLTAIA